MISLACYLSIMSLRQTPINMCVAGSLSKVIEQLVDAHSLPPGAECSRNVAELPVCVSIKSGASASDLLADLVGGTWLPEGNGRILTRTASNREKQSAEQRLILTNQIGTILAKWRKGLDAMSHDPDKVGFQIQRQIEEYVRTSGRSGGGLVLPLDAIRWGTALDLGSTGIARLPLDGPVYFSSVPDDLNRPLGPEAKESLDTYLRAIDVPSVRQALDDASRLLPGRVVPPADIRKARIYVAITRTLRSVVTQCWVYSTSGKLIDHRGGPTDAGPISVGGVRDLPVGCRFELSPEMKVLIAGEVGSIKESERGALKSLLLANQRSIMEPLAKELASELTGASGDSVGILLADQWLRPWCLAASRRTEVAGILAACTGAPGLMVRRNNGAWLITPRLLVDADASRAPQADLARFSDALFSRSGPSVASAADLADRSTASAFYFGLTADYNRLAELCGVRGGSVQNWPDYYVLRALAAMTPLPEPGKSHESYPLAKIGFEVARQAIASPWLEPESGDANDTGVRCPAAIGDSLLRGTDWRVESRDETLFAFTSLRGGPGRGYDRKEILEPLAHLFKESFASSSDAIANYLLFRAQGARSYLRVNLGGRWLRCLLGEDVTWPNSPSPVKDLPEGKDILRDVIGSGP